MTTGAAERLPGPIPGQVVRVIDGDTVEVSARIWLGQSIRIKVRIAGIDAPERNSACHLARKAAETATAHLTKLLGDGRITLRDLRHDKYAGRVLARLQSGNARDIAYRMLRDRRVWRYRRGFQHRRARCEDLPLSELWSPEQDVAQPAHRNK